MSRHAATPSRRSNESSKAFSASEDRAASVSVAELVSRYRAADSQSSGVGALQPPSTARRLPPQHPVLATELVRRYAAAPSSDRRRHASAESGRPTRTFSAMFAKPAPIKVIARPALVLAAVVATVAVIDAGSAATAPATSAQKATAPAPVVQTSAATVADPPDATSSLHRVSRDVRAAVTVPQIRLRPGQTVPGVWVKPNQGPETSCFCMRWGTMHEGIDLAGPLGSPILAAGDGIVIQAGPAAGFGNTVQIRHANGDITLYGHMRYYFVQAGQHVVAGQKIALVGNEGDSTGPHLHFGVHPAGAPTTWIDPVPWLKARGVSVGPYNPNG